MGNTPLRIIQLSDTHLYADASTALLGVKTQDSFQAVVDLLQSEKGKFDFFLHLGDVSQDYSVTSYVRLADMLKDFNVPIYCIPGNHDDPKVMEKVYPRGMVSAERHILTENWNIILLDSHKPGAVGGHLKPAQFKFMHERLQAYPNHHALVCFHHHPVPVGVRWLDNLGLDNANEFWQEIEGYSQLKHVMFGHVHQEFNGEFNGIKVFSPPSTCIQFKRKQDHFGLENLPPGYRWINLFADGRLDTQVVRCAKYIGEFEAQAKGY